jgi:hypothetical protein
MLRTLYMDLGGGQGVTHTLPGHWLRLSSAILSWTDLSQLAEGEVPERFRQSQWQWLARAITDDPIGNALRLGSEQAKRDGLEVADVVAVLGALCQCWNGPNVTIRQSVRSIAECKQRPKETSNIWSEYLRAKQLTEESGKGRRVEAGSARAWAASNSGPSAGDAVENQDAVFLEPVGEQLVFALADGVGASAGAGAAARIAAVTFTQCLAKMLLDTGQSPQKLFEAGLLAVYRAARQLAEYLSQNARDAQLIDVAPFLDPSTTLYFIRETLIAATDRPALCTTLISGMLRPCSEGWVLDCIRIGDGIVETISQDGVVSTLMDMDRNETAVGSVLSPVRNLKGSEAEHVTKILLPGTWVLVSSDGLPKGHSDAVWTRLQSLSPAFDKRTESDEPTTLAARLLTLAAETGRDNSSETLFRDNLSLILISVP